ncbi:MAG: GNAT family N-acetyltransferase [Candidatus Sericytochromatia bacterium]
MPHKEIALRPFTPADVDKLFRMSQEAALRRYLPDQVYTDRAQAQAVLNYLISCYAEEPDPARKPYVLGVTHQGELIGHVGLSAIERGIEIGYAIEKAQMGKGFAQLAIQQMTALAHQKGWCEAVYGVVDASNLPSIRALEKSHFRFLENQGGRRVYIWTFSPALQEGAHS